MEQNREVFAVPGPVDSLASRGCHRLIRDGARLVETVDDILEELGPLVREVHTAPDETPVRHPAELCLSDQERSLLGQLDNHPVGVDELITRTSLTAAQVLATLSVLELPLAAAVRLLYDRHAALQPTRLLLDDPGVFMANDRTLVQIRERSYLDLLDLALLVVRQRPRALGLAAAAGIAPFAALNYGILSNPETSPAIWPALLFLEAPWATVPLTLVLGGLMFDRPPRAGPILWRMTRALPSLILVHLLLRGALTMTLLLIPLIPGQFWFANEVILLEKVPGLRALRRCLQLSGGRTGEFFMQWVGQLSFGLVFALCFWVGTGAGISALIKSELTWYRPFLTDFSGLQFQLGVWIAIAFFGVARFLIYIDQRISIEGWELRLRLQAAGRDVAEGRS